MNTHDAVDPVDSTDDAAADPLAGVAFGAPRRARQIDDATLHSISAAFIQQDVATMRPDAAVAHVLRLAPVAAALLPQAIEAGRGVERKERARNAGEARRKTIDEPRAWAIEYWRTESSLSRSSFAAWAVPRIKEKFDYPVAQGTVRQWLTRIERDKAAEIGVPLQQRTDSSDKTED